VTLSVVVPTFNRPDRLGRLVSALEAQDYDGAFEVVIVDDGSPAETRRTLDAIAARTPLRLRVIHHDRNRGPAAARNTGWRAARGALVAFTDDDCVPTPAWLSSLVHGFAAADVVQGRTVPDPTGTWGPWSRSVTAEAEDYFATCNVAYRRTVLDAADGFDPAFRLACDDTDLALRAKAGGARTTYAPEALVHHEVSPSDLGAWWRERPRWEGVALVLARYPQMRSVMHNRVFWRPSHPPALAAAAGTTGLCAALLRRPTPASLVAVGASAALLAPYVRYRTRVEPLPGVGPRRRLLLMPVALAADLREIWVLARASARYRTFVL
jgi:glycosyltransferase involved in cell wall biosynthesis